MPMTSWGCHTHKHTHRFWNTHPCKLIWDKSRLIYCSNAFSWAGEDCVRVGVQCWHRTFSFVCTCGRVMTGCCSMLARESRKCVCAFFVCIFLFVWKGVEVGNISLKCVYAVWTTVDLSLRKETSNQTRKREKKTSLLRSHHWTKPSCSGLRVQMSQRQTGAPSYWSPCKIKTTHSDLVVVSCCFCRWWDIVSRWQGVLRFLTRPVQLSRCNRAREVHWWTRGAGQPENRYNSWG